MRRSSSRSASMTTSCAPVRWPCSQRFASTPASPTPSSSPSRRTRWQPRRPFETSGRARSSRTCWHGRTTGSTWWRASYWSASSSISTASTRRARCSTPSSKSVARRDELLESKTLWQRSMIELIAGRWSVAQELATRERNITALYQTVARPGPYFVLSELALHRGELDEARELAAHGYELAVQRRLLGRRRGQPRSRGPCEW